MAIMGYRRIVASTRPQPILHRLHFQDALESGGGFGGQFLHRHVVVQDFAQLMEGGRVLIPILKKDTVGPLTKIPLDDRHAKDTHHGGEPGTEQNGEVGGALKPIPEPQDVQQIKPHDPVSSVV